VAKIKADASTMCVEKLFTKRVKDGSFHTFSMDVGLAEMLVWAKKKGLHDQSS